MAREALIPRWSSLSGEVFFMLGLLLVPPNPALESLARHRTNDDRGNRDRSRDQQRSVPLDPTLFGNEYVITRPDPMRNLAAQLYVKLFPIPDDLYVTALAEIGRTTGKGYYVS